MIKCWKCQAQGDSEIDITNDEEHASKAYPLEGEAEQGWFIANDELEKLLLEFWQAGLASEEKGGKDFMTYFNANKSEIL